MVYYCPSCNESMEKHNYGKILITPIHVCDHCKNIWLDKGELERIQYDYSIVKQNTDANLGRRIKCQKCGHVQDKSDKCSKCGVYFHKIHSSHSQGIVKHRDQSLVKNLLAGLYRRLQKLQDSKNHRILLLRSFLDYLYNNSITNFLVKSVGWFLTLAGAYLGWLILLHIFTNITAPPPKPTDFYSDLSRVSIFYIFAIALAGPIVLAIAFVLWRLFWFTLYSPIQSLTHRYFHPLIKPVIAICLLLLVLESVALFTQGFWTTYWWLNQQYYQAKGQKLAK